MENKEAIKNTLKKVDENFEYQNTTLFESSGTVKLLPKTLGDIAIIRKHDFYLELKHICGSETLIEFEVPKYQNNKVYCINKVPIDISEKHLKNVLDEYGIYHKNLKRELKNNKEPKTIFTFSLTHDSNIYEILKFGIAIKGVKKDVREFVDRSKMVIRCFNCNKLGHTAKTCKNKKSCPRCTKENCKGDCKKENMKCINCGEKHSAAYAGCIAVKKHIQEKINLNRQKTYAASLTRETVKNEISVLKKDLLEYSMLSKIITNVFWEINKNDFNNLEQFAQAISNCVVKTVKNNQN